MKVTLGFLEDYVPGSPAVHCRDRIETAEGRRRIACRVAGVHITHLGHACLLVETANARLLFDPGNLSRGFEDLTGLDAVLVTHEHPDHVDAARLDALLRNNSGASLVLDELTASQVSTTAHTVVAHPGDRLTLGGEVVTVSGGAHAAVYADIPGCPNPVYLVDDGAFLHPGDSFVVPEGRGRPRGRHRRAMAQARRGRRLRTSVRPAWRCPIHEGETTDPAKYAGMLTAFSHPEGIVTRQPGVATSSDPAQSDGGHGGPVRARAARGRVRGRPSRRARRRELQPAALARRCRR